MTEKDHLDLMRSFGQLEEGQKSLGHRVTDFEKRMFDEFKRLREDFKSALGDVVSEMRRTHITRDVDTKEIEKRVDKLEREGSQQSGALSAGNRVLVAVGAFAYIVLNGVVSWVASHIGK